MNFRELLLSIFLSMGLVIITPVFLFAEAQKAPSAEQINQPIIINLQADEPITQTITINLQTNQPLNQPITIKLQANQPVNLQANQPVNLQASDNTQQQAIMCAPQQVTVCAPQQAIMCAPQQATVCTPQQATVCTEPAPVESHWYDRIALSGLIQVGGFVSDHTPTTVGTLPSYIGSSPQASDINVMLAFLTAKAQMTEWLETALTFAYSQRSPSFVRSPAGGGEVLFIDQAYALIANQNCTPWYLKVGRYFIDFGGLDSSSISESTAQLLSLTRASQVSVGFKNWNGFDASVYLFRPLTYKNNTTRANAVGLNLSYEKKNDSVTCDPVEFKVGAGVVSNIVSTLYTSSTTSHGSQLSANRYHSSVPALSLNGMIKIEQFDIGATYIQALKKFSVRDLVFTTNGGATFKGAQPSAYGINGGYSFDVMTYLTRLGLGYQGSRQAAALGRAAGSVSNDTAGVYGTAFAIGIPKSRIYINYWIKDIIKYTDLGFEIDKDKGYGVSNGGTGRSAIIGIGVLKVKFE